jgi:hypothetical protein
MKPRHVLILIAGVLVCALLVGGTTIATSGPRGYKFLGDADAVRVLVEEDGSPVGREARFYLVHRPLDDVLPEARRELEKGNFKLDKAHSGTTAFQRGRGDRVELHSAEGCGHKEVVKRIPLVDRANWTVVKTVDPRMRRAIQRWLIEYGKQVPTTG